MRSLMMEVDEDDAWLIVLYNFVCTLKVRIYSLLFFLQKQPSSQKAFHGLDLVK
jgi:hypothetical protein